MKKNCFLFFTIMSFFCLKAFAIPPEQILERLTWYHGPEWKSLLGEPPETKKSLEVRDILFEIADQRFNFKKFQQYSGSATHIRSVAIAELGNFSQVGQSDPSETLEFLKKIFEKNRHLLDTKSINQFMSSVINSISNIGTPEAMGFLSSQILEGSSVYDSVLVQSIEVSLRGKEELKVNTDFKSGLYFAPNTFLPYKKRPQNFSEEIKQYRTKLSTLARSPDTPKSLKVAARLANLGHSSKMDLPKKTKTKRIPSSESIEKPKVVAPLNHQKPVRKISAANETSRFPYEVVLVLILIVLAIILYKNKKK